MTKKALIIAGKQIQDHKYIYPYYRLEEEGYEVDVAVRGKETVLASIGVKVVPNKYVPELKVSDYDVLIQSARLANIYCIGVSSTVGPNKLADADEIVIRFADLRSSVVIKGILESRRSHA